MFSERVPADRRLNRLSTALAAARGRHDLIDLTVSNPTRAGIQYPPDLLAPLGEAAGLAYRPDPFGLGDAREAVADTYIRRGLRMTSDRVILTASTSEAYSFLFKLLCDPGTTVLTPVPSYPLFDHLVRFDAVEQRRYRLEYHGGWDVDAASLDEAWTDRTRAVLAVSPNNPTGSVLTDAGAAELVGRCASRSAALIVDEVFVDYPLARQWEEPRALQAHDCLLFRLGGLSKTAGLPQVKLGWIAVTGPDALVREALDRLELICDTYLSVSTPVQLAARHLLASSAGVREQIQRRTRLNLAAAGRIAAGAGGAVSVLDPDGGWSLVLRVPLTTGEEALALDLLDRGVIVHPGFFFDFPHEAFLVVSLLPEPEGFARGVQIVVERAHAA
jgi:alanine-synthesizing transaminase